MPRPEYDKMPKWKKEREDRAAVKAQEFERLK